MPLFPFAPKLLRKPPGGLKRVPEVQARHWLIKNINAFSENPLRFIESNRRKYGSIYSANIPLLYFVVATDPEQVKHVLQTNNRNYVKSYDYRYLRIFLGNGLLTSEGDFWRKQRRTMQPAFHRDRLESFVEIMRDSTEALIKIWEKKNPDLLNGKPAALDLHAEMTFLTADIVAKALFSVDSGGTSEEVASAVSILNHYANDRISNPLMPPTWVPTSANHRFKRAAQTIDRLIYGFIQSRHQSGPGKGDLLDMLMEARDEETGEGMNDKQLRDEVVTLYIAGHETTTNALSFAFFLLAKHPEIVEEIRKELSLVLKGRPLSVEDLRSLEYLNQVIKEAMRLYPPAWAIGREALEDDEIDGFYIPAGTTIFLSPYIVHRIPELWPDPEKFDPDRFSPENVKQHHRYAYHPFGGGPRLCIGNNFAMMEMQVILAMLVSQYEISLAPGFQDPPELEPLVTLRPKIGMPLMLKKR